VVVLGGAILMSGLGGVGGVVGSVGTAFTGLLTRVMSTPEPSATLAPALDPPALRAPDDPYTNLAAVTLRGTVPASIAGDPAYRVRIYVTLPDGKPTEVKEVAVPGTATFTVPGVALVDGPNDFTATIVGDDYESEPSGVVTYVLDVEPPQVVISSPGDGSTINRDFVEIEGRSQALSEIVARNEANGVTATASAADDGRFTIRVALAPGPNGVTVTSVDPAGNEGSAVLAVRRGSGKLTADLSVSAYRIVDGDLPETFSARVAVTDPDGRPLEGASVLFTLTIPGIPAIVPSPIVTDGAGVATFRTTIPAGATPGTGPITALVTSEEFGRVMVRTVLTIDP
jgi:hypothetical protein